MKYCQSLLANIDFISKFRMGDILVILKGYYTYYSDSWKKYDVIVSDGCSYYWSVDINITEQKLKSMNVNGSP